MSDGGDLTRRVQKHKRTQDQWDGTFRIGQAQTILDLISRNSILGHKVLVAQEQLLIHDGDDPPDQDDCKAYGPWPGRKQTDTKLLIYGLFQKG